MTIYQTAPATDGYIIGAAAAWSDARATPVFVDDSNNSEQCGCRYDGEAYYCYEHLFEFDISAIATGSTTNNLSVVVESGEEQVTQHDIEVMEISAIGTLTTADFVAGASLQNDYGAVGDDFDSTGRKNVGDNYANIGRASDYSLLMYGQQQRTDVAPTTNGDQQFKSYFVEQTGTTNDPYLEMDDTPVGGGYSYGFVI